MTCLGVLDKGERGDDTETSLKEGGGIEMSTTVLSIHCNDNYNSSIVHNDNYNYICSQRRFLIYLLEMQRCEFLIV